MTTFDILSFQAFLQPRDTDPTPITECTKNNKCHCMCGVTTEGFTTYTFMAAGIQRCFTVYHPLSRKSETLPVVITRIILFLLHCMVILSIIMVFRGKG